MSTIENCETTVDGTPIDQLGDQPSQSTVRVETRVRVANEDTRTRDVEVTVSAGSIVFGSGSAFVGPGTSEPITVADDVRLPDAPADLAIDPEITRDEGTRILLGLPGTTAR